MTSPGELLQLDSKSALYRIAQDVLDEHHPGTLSTWYIPGPPTAITRYETSVTFTLDRALTPIDHWGAIHSFTIVYDRIGIYDILPLHTLVSGFLPTTTGKIMESALRAVGVPYTQGEVVEENVFEAGVVTLVASEDNYRWVSETEITYQLLTVPINDLINQNQIVTNFSPAYSSLNIRTDIINHINAFNKNRVPRSLTAGDVRFGVPIVDNSFSNKTNTKVKVFSVGNDFTGEAYVYYKRREYQQTWVRPIVLTYQAGWTSALNLLTELSEAVGCRIVGSDITNIPISTPPLPGRYVDLIIQFNPASMGYIGFIKVSLYGPVD